MMKSLSLALLALLLHTGRCQIMMDAKIAGQETFVVEEPPLTAEQLALNAKCAQKCLTEICYLADENDCRNFLTCKRDVKGGYYGILQMCAFGTMWAGLQKQKKITCDIPGNVVCLIDYCAGLNLNENFPHYDDNCKTYWTCESKGPKPRCCDSGYFYDVRTNRCRVDARGTCHDNCPFKTDSCLVSQQATAFLDDGNCRTYWDCADRSPHPVCCARPGEGYSPVNGTCVPSGCMDTCPPEYEAGVCMKPGVETYAIHDGSCRTYMKCNPIDGDERWCCPSNNMYDQAAQACIRITQDMTPACDDYCPIAYSEFCPLMANPADPTQYYSIDFGVEVPMPCAPGTLFDISKCGCGVEVKGAPDNMCNMEIDIIFDMPNMIRSGSQNKVDIIRIGLVESSTMLNGRIPWRFNGNLINRIPFAQQPFDKVYISVIFLPEQLVSGPGTKQVLLTNCMNLELGGAPLEIALQNGRVTASVVTELPTGPVQAISAVPYQVGQWQVLTVIYDGNNLNMAIEGQGAPVVDIQPLIGSIAVAAEGLDFGGCAINRGSNEGFVGSMAKLQFTKCLRQEWVDAFNAILPNAIRQKQLIATV